MTAVAAHPDSASLEFHSDVGKKEFIRGDMRLFRRALPVYLILLFAFSLAGAEPVLGQPVTPIEDVVLHPFARSPFVCAEHAVGELSNLGDALGKDCMVIGMDSTRHADRSIPSLFQGDGLENDDWFGWNEPVLAPCDGTVISIDTNERTNRPGSVPRREMLEPASEIRFRCQAGFNVVYAHVREIQVRPGENVSAGAEVALIGNNAVSKAPHVHVGAWRDESPLQIRFDLHALGKLRSPE